MGESFICSSCGFATISRIDFKNHVCMEEKNLKPMSREFFINNVGSWLPEDRFNYIMLLTWERKGRITFWKGNGNLFVIKDVKTGRVVLKATYGGDSE